MTADQWFTEADVEAAAQAYFEQWHSDSGRRWDALNVAHRGDWFDSARTALAAVVPAKDARLAAVAADVWDEAAEATADWMWNNPSPDGTPHDPPSNPYRAALADPAVGVGTTQGEGGPSDE